VVPAATLHSGAIEIVSRPRDARVLLDGNVVGLAPLSIPDVPEGLHEVRVELDGFSPWVGSVRVKGGSRARVGASLRP
jgi:MoaA/NifB/PqqE/SkfB family radical SAM enzyme